MIADLDEGAMLLADKGYDAIALRKAVTEHNAWANIPPKANCKDPICFRKHLHREMTAFYSHTGRPSIDPVLLMRMLIVGYCYSIRFQRRLCEEVSLNLAYRWFCRLDLDDAVPDHSSFSKNRHGRFRDGDLLRLVFERVVPICLAAGLIKGDGFAVDASVIEADASRCCRRFGRIGPDARLRSAAAQHPAASVHECQRVRISVTG